MELGLAEVVARSAERADPEAKTGTGRRGLANLSILEVRPLGSPVCRTEQKLR